MAHRATGLAHRLVVGTGNDPERGEHDLLLEGLVLVQVLQQTEETVQIGFCGLYLSGHADVERANAAVT